MSDLLLLGVFLCFLFVGIKYPIVAFCGYMWTDLITPHQITYGFLKGQKLSLILAVVAILSLILNFNKLQMPKAKAVFVMLIIFLLWIITSNTWAVFPVIASNKFDVVTKALFMATLMSLLVNTKKDFELMVWCIAGCLTFYMFSAGVKTLMGGGGYGARLVPASNNSGFSESSTLATIAVISMALYAGLFNVKGVMLHIKSRWLVAFGILLSFATVIGSTARTGLVAVAAFVFLKLKHKKNFIRNTVIVSSVVVLFLSFAPKDWLERMGGFSSPSTMLAESSRFITWQWAWDNTKEHPLGTGFRGFILNRGQLADYAPEYLADTYERKMYAYHNIFIEVLHTQGYPGIVIYLMLIYFIFKRLKLITSTTDDSWSVSMATMLSHVFVVYIVGGMFIGVAFNPLFFYFVVLVLGLSKIADNEKKL